MKLLPVEEARGRILAQAVRLPAETVDLSAALGRVLAEPIVAARDQPPFAASAMDGWAVRLAEASAPLTVVGESAAGRAYGGTLKTGEAVRIFTGAPVPAGADTVVIQENARREGGSVVFETLPAPGANIRPAGADFRAGDPLLAAGVRLDPWRLSLAAAAGRARLPVARPPRVAVLSTGEEIVPAGAVPGPDQIFNSGGPALCALVATWGGAPLMLTPTGDDETAIAAAVRDVDCDVIVTLGGASVGDHDLVKPALSALGMEQHVESVKLRPGKPTWFAVLADGRRVLGLPGNPASALVCAELFLRPLLAAMQGADADLPMMTAKLASALPANGPREHWMRAMLESRGGDLIAEPMADQDSSLVGVFAKAQALLKRPVDAPAAQAGDVVEVLRLDRS